MTLIVVKVQVLVSPDGTSVFLKFNSLSDVENFIKYFFYDATSLRTAMQVSALNINFLVQTIDTIKRFHQRENMNRKSESLIVV